MINSQGLRKWLLSFHPLEYNEFSFFCGGPHSGGCADKRCLVVCIISYRQLQIPFSCVGWLQRLLTPKERRLEGKYVLTVEPATAPTNYIYDHLATGWMSRMLRRAISNAIVGSVLIISLALVILLKSFQKDLVVCSTIL